MVSAGMNSLYEIAINGEVPLEDRYATVRAMQAAHRINPRDYRDMQRYNEWRRKHRPSRAKII